MELSKLEISSAETSANFINRADLKNGPISKNEEIPDLLEHLFQNIRPDVHPKLTLEFQILGDGGFGDESVEIQTWKRVNHILIFYAVKQHYF